MKTIHRITSVLLLLTASACSSSEPAKPGSGAGPSGQAADKPAAAAANGTALEGMPLVVDLPAGAVMNEGAPGFHSEDGAYYGMVKAAADTDPKDFAAAKKAAEEMLFKKWLKSEKTADGWVLTYVGTGMDMSGKEYDNFNFTVRRKIGSASYDCYGAVKKEADVDKNVKLCQAIKAAP